VSSAGKEQSLPPRRKRTGLLSRGRIMIVATALALLAGGWWLLTQRSTVQLGIVALKRAYRSQRPLEARISGFDYAPLRQARGGVQYPADDIARERAASLLLEAVFGNPGPAARHALGRHYLAQREFGKAADQFTLALRAAPHNAQLHNDQGVTLMEKSQGAATGAESGADIEQLALALEHFNQALALDHDLPEAVFNRALLYQRLRLPQQAREAWQRYLQLDAISPWADEARQNLRRLTEAQQQATPSAAELLQRLRQARQQGADGEAWQVINQHRDRVGSLAIHQLLDNYELALAAGDTNTAVHSLELLSYAGAVAEQMVGDRFISDLASFYQRQSAARQVELRAARAQMRAGQKQFDQTGIEEAKRLFAQAKEIFSRIGDKGEALLAEYMWAHCHREQAEMAARVAIHARLERVCAESKYEWLLTQILIADNSIQNGLANHSSVIRLSHQGAQMARANGDTNGLVKFLQQSAVSYLSIGDYHHSLSQYQAALFLLNQQPIDPMVRWAIYMSIAFPLNALGRSAAAAEYQREALRLAQAIGRPGPICRSHLNYAVTCGLLRDYDEAAKHARSAVDLANNLPEGVARRELLALAGLKLGEHYRQLGDFAQAAVHFAQVISLYDGLDTREAYEYLAHKGRLLTSLAQGGPASLETEIKLALELFERNRVKIREESNRNIFFDGEQDVYDIAIDFWYTQKRDERTAFELAERSRARSLLDLISDRPRLLSAAASDPAPEEAPSSLTLPEVQARLPEQSQIVQYAMLEDKLLIWVISRTQPLVSREQKISSRELNEEIAGYLRLIGQKPDGDQTAVGAAARRFYQLLIDPIAPLLDQKKQICFIPDKLLNQLPYAALIAPKSGRFLIEDYSIVFAPSATMFITCSEAALRKQAVKNEKLLAVGDPAFDRNIFSAQSYLKAMQEEAEVIGAFYPRSQRLIGAQATKRRLESAIAQVDLLHLALHCVVNQHSPMHSQLLLAAPDGGGDSTSETEGVLQAHEIYHLPLTRLRLVVLAACRSGVERYYRGEGMVGISRPFIAKGVPLVVASLWEVDPEATKDLMIRFHDFRKLKMQPTAEALRQSQLGLLQGSDPLYRQPYYWASFVTIGGYARF